MKFKPSLTACAHCLLTQGRRFQNALTDRSDSLDRLNQQVGVRTIRALFQQRHALSTGEAQQQAQAQFQHVQARFARRGQHIPPTVQFPNLTNVYVLDVPADADVEVVAARYQQDPHVEYAQPDYMAKVQFTPNDPYYSSVGSWNQPYDDLWGLKKIQAASAWDVTQGAGVVVAVVDTGLDMNHPDIAANVWVNPGEILNNGVDDDQNGFIDDLRGWDFANDDNDPTDDFGHGTHVAGTIAAIGNNNLGIIGVAPQAKIMAIKGINQDGAGFSSDLAEGIMYAAQNGAGVVNNSWGCAGPCPSNPVLEDAVRAAYALGTVVVFSAGNDYGLNVGVSSPQNMTNPKPIVVAASTEQDAPASFTSTGILVDVTAPGGGTDVPPPTFAPFRNVLSLKSAVVNKDMTSNGSLVVGQQYLRQAGTSMSAPHVAGLAALVLAYRPTLTAEQVRSVLRASADDVHAPGLDPETGTGRINAAAALTVESVLDTEISEPSLWAERRQQDGPITVRGTAAGNAFQHYQLLYKREVLGQPWLPIGQAALTPVSGGVLGTWVVSGLPDGLYTLRLVATDGSGRQFQEAIQVLLEETLPTRITTAAAVAQTPAIWGDRIVWTDFRFNFTPQIFLYDLVTNTERQLTSGLGLGNIPAIWGDRVAWLDFTSGVISIVIRDVRTNATWTVGQNSARQETPAIWEDRVAWSDFRNGNADIYLFDLATNMERQITANASSQENPAIWGDRIVWLDGRHGKTEVYVYDLATNTERRITNNNFWEEHPTILGDLIAWTGYPADDLSDIYLYDLATDTERRLLAPDLQKEPFIWGDRIVWTDFRNRLSDVYLYDLASETERPIAFHPLFSERTPAIWQDRIVWKDTRNGGADIYMKEVHLNHRPALDPLSGQTIVAGKLLVVPVTATDPDQELLTLSAPQRPNGAALYPQGDVTQNNSLGQEDVALISACAAGTTTCTFAQRKLGDVAGPTGYVPDGKLTSVDSQAVQAMLDERTTPTGNPALVDLLNSALLLWQTAVAHVDDDPYPARVRVVDALGAADEATIGITVQAYPPTTNLLVNGGFEAGQADWSSWGTNKQLTTATAYTGATALQMTLGGASRTLAHELIPVTGGARYQLRVALQTAAATGTAKVEVRWRAANGNLIRTDTFGATTGTTGWGRSTSPVLTAPTNAATVKLVLVATPGAGTAFFDAVRLEQVP